MVTRRALIPYHFAEPWPIHVGNGHEYVVIHNRILSHRLATIRELGPEVVVAGDCMAALAAHRPSLDLVWFDAHGDFHTLATTLTGSIGGMPLAMLCGYGDMTLMRAAGCPEIPAYRVTHVGGSEFDPGERRVMEACGVNVMNRLLPLSQHTERRVHLHIDTDVIRSAELPNSKHPALNGMPVDEFWAQLDIVMPATDVLSIKTPDPTQPRNAEGHYIVNEIIRRYDARI